MHTISMVKRRRTADTNTIGRPRCLPRRRQQQKQKPDREQAAAQQQPAAAQEQPAPEPAAARTTGRLWTSGRTKAPSKCPTRSPTNQISQRRQPGDDAKRPWKQRRSSQRRQINTDEPTRSTTQSDSLRNLEEGKRREREISEDRRPCNCRRLCQKGVVAPRWVAYD